jgi:hypothetical protein
LVHVYKPSPTRPHWYDAFIYLVRHQKDSATPVKMGLSDVKKAEFYFGASWGHAVFPVENTGNNIIGVRTQAYGTFLATCRVTFSDSKQYQIIIYRYIDFEMLTEHA